MRQGAPGEAYSLQPANNVVAFPGARRGDAPKIEVDLRPPPLRFAEPIKALDAELTMAAANRLDALAEFLTFLRQGLADAPGVKLRPHILPELDAIAGRIELFAKQTEIDALEAQGLEIA